MITAPYNFVPLNKKIFYPPWGDRVSLDIPFSDGESGVIDIEIEAKSPIFIRNSYQEGDDYYVNKDGNKISTEFYSYFKDGKREFYIPGSSLKGMIRNIVEIISYGEIEIDEEKHKKIMSVRDMTPKKLFKYPMVGIAKYCGYLIEKNGKYIIKDCGKIIKISYREIQRAKNEWIKNIDSAIEKYKKIKDRKIKFQIKGYKAVYDENSDNIGELVFTNKINRKRNEFVFKTNEKEIEIEKKVVDDFKKVYFEDENSILGQYWKGKKKIPVFYMKNGGKIIAIGLTQIFKLAYKKTIYEAAKQEKQNRLDLAKTIFGTTSLKGRVFFSHLKSTTQRYESKKSEVLGSPKPSYYPNYILQTDVDGDRVNKYTTLMDNNATIRGFKRYPIQPNIDSNRSNENEDVKTKFKPLDKGTKFKGKIVVHNLKKVEIGALLSALTFHNNKDCFHNIGMAKPLGYGKIKIDISLSGFKYKIDDYLKEFENLMDNWEEKDYKKWINSNRIKELLAMAKNSMPLKYQKLEPENEFVKAKKNREYLLNFTRIKHGS